MDVSFFIALVSNVVDMMIDDIDDDTVDIVIKIEQNVLVLGNKTRRLGKECCCVALSFERRQTPQRFWNWFFWVSLCHSVRVVGVL